MITWNERRTGNVWDAWDAYAGPVHMEVSLMHPHTHPAGQYYWGVRSNEVWLEDELTFDAATKAALRYALAELDCIIEQCQDAKREIEEMGL